MKPSTLALAVVLLPAPALAAISTAGSTAGSTASTTPAPTANELGQICYEDGSSRRITPTDALWLGRMVHGETRGRPTRDDAEAMLWSIAQRAYIWGFPKWDLSRLVYSYSQPISPAWAREGSKCGKYYAAGYEGEIPDSCSEKRVTLRAEYREKAWEDLSPVAQRAVLDFASGTLDNPVPGSVGWWDPGYWRKRVKSGKAGKEHEVEIGEIDGNVYFELTSGPDTSHWTTQTVRVVGPGQACGSGTTPTKTETKPKPKTTPTPKPALGSCDTSFTYHKKGRVASWTTNGSGAIDSLTLESTGWNHRVCDDAAGMIYLGSATDRFVEDAAGQKIRFTATAVEADRTVVRVTEGRLVPSMLEGNRRVVIRAKKR